MTKSNQADQAGKTRAKRKDAKYLTEAAQLAAKKIRDSARHSVNNAVKKAEREKKKSELPL